MNEVEQSASGGSGVGSQWTAERRRNAKPKPPKRAGADRASSPDTEPGEYVTTQVADMTVYPYSAIGALFFENDGDDWVGTACVVAGQGVYTAAHNLMEDGVASTGVVFFPQYSPGGSLGAFELDPDQVNIAPGWSQDEIVENDFATFKTTEALPTDQTGILAYAVNSTPDQGAGSLAIGYTDGENMWQCAGPLSFYNPTVVEMQGNFEEGASGGPWMIPLGGNLTFMGSTARFYEEQEAMWSPYFGDAVGAVIQAVQ